MMEKARISLGFRFRPAVVIVDTEELLVWEQNGIIYQWEKGTKYIENIGTGKKIPIIKVVVKY